MSKEKMKVFNEIDEVIAGKIVLEETRKERLAEVRAKCVEFQKAAKAEGGDCDYYWWQTIHKLEAWIYKQDWDLSVQEVDDLIDEVC